MEFVRLTRDTEIGANSYALRLGDRLVVLDSGMHPKAQGAAALPDFSRISGLPVACAVLSHAHQDHVGSLPVLTREHDRIPVFMTSPTARIAEIMLHNSVNVMTRQREERKLDNYPMFTHRGVDLCAQQWQQCPLRRRFALNGDRATDDEETSIELYDAGHILGSAGVMVRHGGKTIFYTGDVNFDDQTLARCADFPEEGVDVLIMETTRGDSPKPAGWTRVSEEKRLLEALREAFQAGGAVTLPVFALGKTQEILAMLWRFRVEGLLAHVPTYIGGLSTKITTVYDHFAESGRRALPELQLLQEMAPYVLSGNEALSISPRARSIYALSSGMMTENTISNLFARRILPDAGQSLFFVGYSDPDSPAGRVRAASPGQDVILDPSKPPVPLRCRTNAFNFSAHATRESLLEYATRLRPKKILLVHGDRPAVDWFQRELSVTLPGTAVLSPEPGVWMDL